MHACENACSCPYAYPRYEKIVNLDWSTFGWLFNLNIFASKKLSRPRFDFSYSARNRGYFRHA